MTGHELDSAPHPVQATTPPPSQAPLTRAVWVRLTLALAALAGGGSALVVAIDLVRSTLS